jgi:hypothetical protein
MQLEREDQEVAEIELCLVEGKGGLGGSGGEVESDWRH